MNSSKGSSVCAQQKIVIPNSQNEKLVGLLHETGSKEIVVLCHGFNSNKDNQIIKKVATALQKQSISAFRFDFSGYGESQGSFNYGNYNYDADDIHSVIQHFSHTNRLVTTILGYSRGGDIVLLYASKYPHTIRKVVSISERFDLKKGIRLGEGFLERIKQEGFINAIEGQFNFRVTEESLMERLNMDMHQACLKIGKECKVLIVHGSHDKVVPAKDAKEFAKIIPNHQLEIVQGANHGYSKHQRQLVSMVTEYIKTVTLKNNN